MAKPHVALLVLDATGINEAVEQVLSAVEKLQLL